MELEFKTTRDKKTFIKDKIDYFVKKYDYRNYEANITRINLLNTLYNAYRNEYKDLINNLLDELKQSYESEKNKKLNKVYTGTLNKFRKVIVLNNERFKNFMDNLDLNNSINVIFRENSNNKIIRKHYINIIKHIKRYKRNTKHFY